MLATGGMPLGPDRHPPEFNQGTLGLAQTQTRSPSPGDDCRVGARSVPGEVALAARPIILGAVIRPTLSATARDRPVQGFTYVRHRAPLAGVVVHQAPQLLEKGGQPRVGVLEPLELS